MVISTKKKYSTLFLLKYVSLWPGQEVQFGTGQVNCVKSKIDSKVDERKLTDMRPKLWKDVKDNTKCR